MSASSSPGWTWSLFLTDRWLPVRAPAAAAAFFRRRRGRLDLSGLDRRRSPTLVAHSWNEDDSRAERHAERPDDWELGCLLDSVSVTET